MSRKKIEVDKGELVEVVNQIEEGGPLPALSALHEKVAQSEWGLSISLTPSVVALRIKEFGIETQTKKGRKGPSKLSPEHLKRMQEGRKSGAGKKEGGFDVSKLKGVTPSSYEGLIRKIEKGSRASAVKLKCLECSGFYKEEVRNCPISSCALWHFRPYKKKEKEKN